MKNFSIAIVLLTATVIYVNFLIIVQPMPPLRPISEFPAHLGDFSQIGENQTFSDRVMASLGVDHYIMREYRDKDGYSLWLYIGYYESQTEGQIIHSPKHCMPGSGWNTIESKDIPLVVADSSNTKIKINEMVLQKGLEKQLAFYWYHSRGRIVANEYIDRFYMILDSLMKKRSDGALVRITGSGNDLLLDEEKQRQFAKIVLKEIDYYLPSI